MNKSGRLIVNTLYYFVPPVLMGILCWILIAFEYLFSDALSATASAIMVTAAGLLWLVVWVLWARRTPCRRKWDVLAPIAAAFTPWYLWAILYITNGIFGLFILFPANMLLIVPSAVLLIITLFISSAHFRRESAPPKVLSTFKKRVLLRSLAVVVGVALLVLPLLGVAAMFPRLDADYQQNVLAYYRAEHGESTNIRTGNGFVTYQLEGLSPDEFLGTHHHWSVWEGTLPRIIMHPDTLEPLTTLPLRSLRLYDAERGETIITDAATLTAFRAFVSDESNGTPKGYSGEYSVYTEMQDDKTAQLYFDVPCNMYWFADYEIQDDKIIVYGRLHNSTAQYAYDVTHILGDYLAK